MNIIASNNTARKLFLSFFLLVPIWLGGCQSRTAASTKELQDYANDPANGLAKDIERGDIALRMTYSPKDIMIEQGLRDVPNYGSDDIDSVRVSLHKYHYFVFHASRGGQEIVNKYVNTSGFEAALNYVSFDIANDIKLVQGRDTIPVFDLTYTRTFNLSQQTTLLLAFEHDLTAGSDFEIIFHDTFFGTGSSVFPFQVAAIKNIPSLSDFKSTLK